MRKIQLFILTIALVVLAACGDKTYEPRDINTATDVCYICNMSMTHVDYAAQIVLKNGDQVVFDDLGCLMEYVLTEGDNEIGAGFIRDTNSSQWLDVKEAAYVYAKDFWTPMNYGVLAFASQEDAKAYIEEQGEGKVLTYDELLTFEWGVHAHQ